MSLTRFAKSFFFTPTSKVRSDGTLGGTRFLKTDKPEELTYREMFDSIANMVEVSDTATTIQQGLVMSATPTNITNGDAFDVTTGFSLYVNPSQLKAASNSIDSIGTSYEAPHVIGTHLANGTALLAALTAAALLTPGGNALSASNRVQVLLMPAIYDLGAATVNLNNNFIDLIGMSNSPDAVILRSTGIVVNTFATDVRIKNLRIETGTLNSSVGYNPQASSSATTVENVNIVSYGLGLSVGASTYFAGVYTKIKIISDATSTADDNSFTGVGTPGTGTFTDIEISTNGNANCFDNVGSTGSSAGTYTRIKITAPTGKTISAFATGGGFASGTFTDITIKGGVINCFGTYANGGASGTFTRCTTESTSGDNSSFGSGSSSISSGTFNYCSAIAFLNNYAFGGNSVASGTFTNCISTTNSGNNVSFGGGGAASGIFIRCIASSVNGNMFSFGSTFGSNGVASGSFKDCKTTTAGGTFAFGGGNSAIASGTFENCTVQSGGSLSLCFGGNAGVGGACNGLFTNCSVVSLGIDYSFGGGYANVASGIFINCTVKSTSTAFSFGGSNSAGGHNIASGTFKNCTVISGADNYSFGGNGTASGSFKDCFALTTGWAGGTCGAFGEASTGVFEDCGTLSTSGANNSFGIATSLTGGGGKFKNCRSFGITSNGSFNNGLIGAEFDGCVSKSGSANGSFYNLNGSTLTNCTAISSTGLNYAFGNPSSASTSGKNIFTNCTAIATAGSATAFTDTKDNDYYNCIAVAASGTGFNFCKWDNTTYSSGNYYGCKSTSSGADGSFSGNGGASSVGAGGYYENCTATSTAGVYVSAFGGTATGTANAFGAFGTFKNCVATILGAGGVNNAFGGGSAGGGGGAASGKFYDCLANGDVVRAFGYAGPASGNFYRCHANALTENSSFGGSSSASGLFQDCVAAANAAVTDNSFGATASATGTFIRISRSGKWTAAFSGILRDSDITTPTAFVNTACMTNVLSAARIYNCTFRQTGTAAPLTAAAASTPIIGHCRAKSTFNAGNIANTLGTDAAAFNIINVNV